MTLPELEHQENDSESKVNPVFRCRLIAEQEILEKHRSQFRKENLRIKNGQQIRPDGQVFLKINQDQNPGGLWSRSKS